MTFISIEPPARGTRRWSGIAVAAGLALIVAVSLYGFAIREARTLAVETAFAAKRIAVSTKPVERKSVEEQSRWAALDAERNFNWAVAFKAIENTLSPEIQLQEFIPDKANKTVILKCLASSRGSLTQYASALSSDPTVSKVYIVREASKVSGNGGGIAFEVKLIVAPQ